MKEQLVAVLWLDAVCRFDVDENTDLSPVQVETHGLLLKDCPEYVAVAAEKLMDGGWRGVTTIPRGMVIKMTSLGRRRR